VPPAVVLVLLPLASGLMTGVPNLPRDDLDHLVAVEEMGRRVGRGFGPLR